MGRVRRERRVLLTGLITNFELNTKVLTPQMSTGFMYGNAARADSNPCIRTITGIPV